MDQLQFVVVERTASVATVTIQRPDKLNALNARVVAELTQAFAGLHGDNQAACPAEPAVVNQSLSDGLNTVAQRRLAAAVPRRHR